MGGPTSGTVLVDELIDGVRIGDNLVFVATGAAAPLDLLVDRFVAASEPSSPLVIVNVADPWTGPVPPGARVLDWAQRQDVASTGGAAAGSGGSPASDAERSGVAAAAAAVASGQGATIECLPPTARIDEAIATLHLADERVGEGASFVFDRLTAVQDRWGDDAPLTLFLAACPRLYRRRSLALWPIERDRHRPTFLRRLTEITQVVVELDADADDGEVTLTVRKADGRDAQVVGRSVRAEVADGDLVATGARTTVREQLGTIIRGQRLQRGLAQADVARRVGISPSALSQIERGVRGPSGDTLMRLWEVLGVPFGPAAGSSSARHGYRLARRSGRERVEPQPGLSAERILDGPIEQWLLQVAPAARGDRPPFAVKRIESAVVVRGVLEVAFDHRVETLHEGDGFSATDAVVTSWANPSADVTEVLWTMHPPN